MDLRLILTNIDWRLKILELSDDKASKLANAPDAIRNLRRRVAGEMDGGMTMTTLQKLAGALQCTPQELMEPRPEENIKPIPGLRDQLVSQLAWLNGERDRVLRQLNALDNQAETPAEKPRRKKNR